MYWVKKNDYSFNLARCIATFVIVCLLALVCPTLRVEAATVLYDGITSIEDYDFVMDVTKLSLDNAKITFTKGSSTVWERNYNYWPNGPRSGIDYAAGLYRGQYHITNDPIDIIFYNAVQDSYGKSFDLHMSIYDVWIYVGNSYAKPCILMDWGWLEYYAGGTGSVDDLDIGVWQDILFQVYEHNTTNVVEGNFVFGLYDLDMPGTSSQYGTGQDGYQEGITILDGCVGSSHVDPNTFLQITNNGNTFLSTRPSSNHDEWLKTAVTFKGKASGTKIRWTGHCCGTALNLDMRDFFDTYTITATAEGPGSATPASSVAFKGQNKSVLAKADTYAYLKSLKVDNSNTTVTNNANMTQMFNNVRADHTIHAVFEYGKYSVEYAKNSAAFKSNCPDKTITGTTTKKTCTFESTYNHHAALTNPYYYFTSWKNGNSTVAGSSSFKNLASSIGATVTETAQWSPKKYTIDYHTNKTGATGADKTESNISVESSGKAWDPKSTAKLTGYYITHWNTKQDLSGTNVPFGYEYSAFWYKPTTNTEDVYNLYGVWVPITYYVEYGNGSSQFKPECPDKSVTGDTSKLTCLYDVTYNHHGSLTNSYYYFTGWKSGTNQPVLPESEFSNLTSTHGATITETAQWKPKTYTIKYNANRTGATGADKTVSDISVESNGNFWTPESAYSKGYYIDHWNTKADDTGTSYSLESSYTAFWYKPSTNTEDVINLYAIWKPYSYEVAYKAGEGAGTDIIETWVVDESHNLYNNTPNLSATKVSSDTTPHFTKEGYYIDYWIPSFPTSVYEVDSNKTSNQLTGTGYSNDQAISKTLSVSNLLIPGNNTYSHIVSQTKGFSEKVILTAHWAPIKYKVTFYNDSTVPGEHGAPYLISSNTYVSDPWDFGAENKIPTVGFTRKNAFGDSTFLGYCFMEGCIMKNPTYVVEGQSPESFMTGRKSTISSSAFAPNVSGKDMHANSAKTINGTSWKDYFKYLNDGQIQSFKLYAVWDDCPGIAPVDVEQQKDVSVEQFNSSTAGLGSNTQSGSDLEYHILHLPNNENTIWDREDDISYLAKSKDNYYIKNFRNLGIKKSDNVSSYKLTFVIKDSFGHTYEVSRKLYSGKYYDIMLHENITEFGR